MIRPLQIVFRNIQPSAALEREIRTRASWIDTFYPRIVGCRVFVGTAARHRVRGRHVHVRIELSLPGQDVVVSHAPTLHAGVKDVGEASHRKGDDIDAIHKDALTAIHEAFDSARRRLQDIARRQRGDVKTHRAPARRRSARPTAAALHA
jgi:hypothetical protein